MPEEAKTPVKDSSLTEQVSETFDNLKEEAAKLGDQLKDGAEDAWEKVKAVDVKAELKELKEDAAEVIDDLTDKAKGLWDKITGSADDTAEEPKK